MKRTKTRRALSRRGFTLVEVIVVIVIIAILAAIVIPSMSGWTDNAREKLCLRNRREAEKDYNTFDLMNSGDSAGGQTFTDFLAANGEPLSGMCPSGGTCTLVEYGEGTAGAYCTITCSIHDD